MKLKLKRFWWFLTLGEERVRLAWDRIESLERQISTMDNYQMEQSALIIALTSEVNALRNASQHQTQTPPPPNTRRAATWREFAQAAESPQPIELRKS